MKDLYTNVYIYYLEKELFWNYYYWNGTNGWKLIQKTRRIYKDVCDS